jgi:WD40 repeat protein
VRRPRLGSLEGSRFTRIWDWRRAEVITRISGYAERLAFDPSGTRIAGTRYGQARIWDVQSGEVLATLASQPGDVLGIAFSPDGSRLATSTGDGTVHLFDAASGLQRLALSGAAAPGDVAFSPDGSMLASSTFDGTARVWALDIDDLLEIARQNVTRSLTDEECRQYLHLQACLNL